MSTYTFKNNMWMRISLILLAIAATLEPTKVLAQEYSTPRQLRRAPYKEVRTKANQDPQRREALRQQLEQKHQERLEERKKIEAQMLEARSKAATNKNFAVTNLTNGVSAPKPASPAGKKEKTPNGAAPKPDETQSPPKK